MQERHVHTRHGVGPRKCKINPTASMTKETIPDICRHHHQLLPG